MLSKSNDKHSQYSSKVDLWSVGVIMFIMISGYHPFDPECNCNDAQMRINMRYGKYNFNDPAWNTISDSAKDLISHLIVVDPAKRYGVDELLQHPWILQTKLDNQKSPISPGINSNLRNFQKKRKIRKKIYNSNRNLKVSKIPNENKAINS